MIFDDIYRARSNALPDRWRKREQFTVLEKGFRLGLNFLTTWAACLADPQRCQTLHFVSIEAWPVSSEDIVRSAEAPTR